MKGSEGRSSYSVTFKNRTEKSKIFRSIRRHVAKAVAEPTA
jgi:hypothetical protein